VALSKQQVWTIADFQEHVSLPENSDRLYELINGEIVEKMPGRTRNSEYGLVVASLVRPFCRAHHLACHLSGADGAYEIQGNVLVPDFAYKRTPMSTDYPDPVAPEWVIEVISPTDKAPEIRKKRQIYVRAEILYWEMYPESENIDVYVPGQLPQTIEIDGVLDVGDLIPGLTITAKEIFSDE
jgi:Uma2 family endonuclease